MDTVVEPLRHVVDVELAEMEPSTMLLVRTVRSVYRIVVTGQTVLVQGGPFFPDPTPVHVESAHPGSHVRKAGWITVGRLMALRTGGQITVTSLVVGITAERCVTRRGQ